MIFQKEILSIETSYFFKQIIILKSFDSILFVSSPGRSPGRAIVPPPALALASALALAAASALAKC